MSWHRRDTHYNDILHNATQHNKLSMLVKCAIPIHTFMLSVVMLSSVMLSVVASCCTYLGYVHIYNIGVRRLVTIAPENALGFNFATLMCFKAQGNLKLTK
jgi:hypothetical protein